MQFYLITALLFSLLVAVFAIQNTEVVVIEFIVWEFSVSLVLVLLGSAIAGALALYFLGLFKQVGAWMKIRQLNNRKTELEAQLKKVEKKISEMEEKLRQSSKTGEETPLAHKTGDKDVSRQEAMRENMPDDTVID